GFPYPVASDPPCNWPTTMLALASALDTKFQGFDTDTARLAKRKYVKVSRSGSPTFSYDSNQGRDMLFDPVEPNNGTPTYFIVERDHHRQGHPAPARYRLLRPAIVPRPRACGRCRVRRVRPGLHGWAASAGLPRAREREQLGLRQRQRPGDHHGGRGVEHLRR